MRCRWLVLIAITVLSAQAATEDYGPEAAIAFARSYRGEVYRPDERVCYPDAKGVPFGDCANIVPMTSTLWTPAQLRRDFQQRQNAPLAGAPKRGILVMLKTERCAPTGMRACTVTTAALEKRATALAAEFQVYGVLLKPRDDDNPPGTLPIEKGDDAWKNQAAGIYQFHQGPGATLVFLDPEDGSVIARTNALTLELLEKPFLAAHGSVPKLDAQLRDVLTTLAERGR